MREFNVGDQVAVVSHGNNPMLRKVERITKTMVILDSGSRWRKDGTPVGEHDPWRPKRIRHWSDEDARARKHAALVRRVMRIDLEKLSDEQLRAVLEIAEEPDHG